MNIAEYFIHSQPLKLLFLGIKWIFTELIIELSRIKTFVLSAPMDEFDESPDYDTNKDNVPKPVLRGKGAEGLEAEEFFKAERLRKLDEVETIFYPCDKRADLYVVNETFIRGEHSFSSVDDVQDIDDIR